MFDAGAKAQLEEAVAAVVERWDWMLFAMYYLSVKDDETQEVVPYIPREAQGRLWKVQMEGYRQVIVLKPRAVGITTAEIIRAVVFMLCKPWYNAIVASDDRAGAERIAQQILRPIIETLQVRQAELLAYMGVKVALVQKELRVVHPRGESTMFIGGLRDETFGLGIDIHSAHKTEAAYMTEMGRKTWQNLLARAKPEAFVTQESTAEGMANDFYTDYWDNKEGGPAKTVFFPWYLSETARVKADHSQMPREIRGEFELTERERRLKSEFGVTMDQFRFYRWRAMLDGAKVKQYFPENDEEAFLSSEVIGFSQEILRQLYNGAPAPLQNLPGEARAKAAELGWAPGLDEGAAGMRIWSLPEPGRRYTMGIDSAKGVLHGDRTVLSLLNDLTGEQVAVIRGPYRPDLTADMAVKLGYWYNDAFIVPEMNGIGNGITEALAKTYFYPQLFRHRFDKPAGYDMTNDRAAELFRKTSAGLASLSLRPNDRMTLTEMRFYGPQPGNRFGAPSGKHDDCVRAFELSCVRRVEGLTTGNRQTIRVSRPRLVGDYIPMPP